MEIIVWDRFVQFRANYVLLRLGNRIPTPGFSSNLACEWTLNIPKALQRCSSTAANISANVASDLSYREVVWREIFALRCRE
jgi:hypothetical protein